MTDLTLETGSVLTDSRLAAMISIMDLSVILAIDLDQMGRFAPETENARVPEQGKETVNVSVIPDTLDKLAKNAQPVTTFLMRMGRRSSVLRVINLAMVIAQEPDQRSA